MIKAIVFDLDGMVYHEPDRFGNFYADKFGVPASDLSDFFVKEYTKCQTGELDITEVFPRYFAKWQWNKSVNELLDLWASFGNIDKKLVSLIDQLKVKGIKCALATNNEKYRFERMNDKYKFAELFDVLVNSYKIGDLKPSNKFCNQMIKMLELKPEEILVCDDKPKFIKELESYGFKTCLYQNVDQFVIDLKNHGINI